MKIESNLPLPGGDRSREIEQRKFVSERKVPVSQTEDRVRLALDRERMEELRIRSSGPSEIRRERVDALARAIGGNRYEVSNERIAESLIEEMLRPIFPR